MNPPKNQGGPTTIPQGKYWFSSDYKSQAWPYEVNTWMGDRLGILRVVDFSILREVLLLLPPSFTASFPVTLSPPREVYFAGHSDGKTTSMT